MIGTLLLWIGMYDIFDLTIDRFVVPRVSRAKPHPLPAFFFFFFFLFFFALFPTTHQCTHLWVLGTAIIILSSGYYVQLSFANT